MGKSSPSAFLHDLSANRSCFLKYTITENMPQEELERTVEDDFHREFSFILNIFVFFFAKAGRSASGRRFLSRDFFLRVMVRAHKHCAKDCWAVDADSNQFVLQASVRVELVNLGKYMFYFQLMTYSD